MIADLANGGARRPRDVRLATGLTTGGVSNLLARLEAAGVIARAADDDRGDRRAVRIELTVYGRAVAGDVSAALVRGVRRCTTTIAELIVLLEHLGAHGGPSGRDRLLPAHAGAPRALAALSTELTEALTTPSTDPTAALVLLAVADTGACRPRYLGERLGLSSAGVSATIDRLERSGSVARAVSSDPFDQRARWCRSRLPACWSAPRSVNVSTGAGTRSSRPALVWPARSASARPSRLVDRRSRGDSGVGRGLDDDRRDRR